MEETRQDLIDNYLMGRLNEQESKIFQEKLKEDEELRLKYEFTLMATYALSQKEKEEKLKELREWRNDPKVKAIADKKRSRKKPLLIVTGTCAAAAAVVIVLVLSTTMKYNQIQMAPNDYNQLMFSKDAETLENDEISEIEELIEQENYEEALRLIEDVEKEWELNVGADSKQDSTESLEETSPAFTEKKSVTVKLMELKAKTLMELEKQRKALGSLDETDDNQEK